MEPVEVGGHLKDLRDGDDAVPPMPGIRTSTSSRTRGAGLRQRRPERRAVAVFARFFPGVTITNDGQSPFRQERSWLQEAWWIRVLRPNSVSTGWTDRQVDFSPQSPQPSHTRSLIHTRSAGAGQLAALAQAALLARAAVVVDQHGHARRPGQLALRPPASPSRWRTSRIGSSSTPR